MESFLLKLPSVFAVEIVEDVFLCQGQAFDGYSELRIYHLVNNPDKKLVIVFNSIADEGIKAYWKNKDHVKKVIEKSKKRKDDEKNQGNGNGQGGGSKPKL